MRVLSSDDVDRLLPMDEAISIARQVFIGMGTAAIVQPVRTVVHAPDRAAVLASMPAHLQRDGSSSFGLKGVVVDPDNSGRGLETHQGVVVAFDSETSAPSAVIEAGALTAIRTAAASAVATHALAQVRTGRVAVLGTGRQAQLHMRAIAEVHPSEVVALWGRNRQSAEGLAQWARHHLGVTIEVCATAGQAACNADVVSTVTSARSPIITAASVAAGAHVNAVGSCFPHTRELSTDLVANSRVVVDQRDAAQQEAGDLLLAAREVGAIVEHSAELGEVLREQRPGRSSADEVTIFESLGFAALDVATAHYLAAEAINQDVGAEVTL